MNQIHFTGQTEALRAERKANGGKFTDKNLRNEYQVRGNSFYLFEPLRTLRLCGDSYFCLLSPALLYKQLDL